MKITNSHFNPINPASPFNPTQSSRNLNTKSQASQRETSAQSVSDSAHFSSASNYNPTHSIDNFTQNKPIVSQKLYKKDIVSQLLQDESLLQTAKISKPQTQEEIAQNEFYGYSIDEKGYMGEDFNIAAGLPNSFKLHKDTLEEIIERGKDNNKRWHEAFFGNGSVTNVEVFKYIDIANTIKQYYNVFTQIIPEAKETYSRKEVEELPRGFSDLNYIGNAYMIEDTATHKAGGNYTTLEHFKVTNLYNRETYKEAKILESQLSSVMSGFAVFELNFSPKDMENLTLYATDNDTFSQEALFVSFLNSQRAEILEGGETQFSLTILEGRQEINKLGIEDILRQNLDSLLQKQALQSPEKLKQLIKLNIQDSISLLGKSKTFTPNEIAANFGGAMMDIYAFTQLGHYRSSLDSMATSIDLTIQFTQAVHNNWVASEKDIQNYTQDLYKRAQNFLHKTRS